MRKRGEEGGGEGREPPPLQISGYATGEFGDNPLNTFQDIVLTMLGTQQHSNDTR